MGMGMGGRGGDMCAWLLTVSSNLCYFRGRGRGRGEGRVGEGRGAVAEWSEGGREGGMREKVGREWGG